MNPFNDPGPRAREFLWRTAALAVGLLSLNGGVRAEEAAATESLTPVTAIAQAAEQAVRQRLPDSGAGTAVQADELDPRLRLAACHTQLATFIGGDGALRDRTSVGVRCDGPVKWTVYVIVSLRSQVEVLSARQPLARGSVPQASDFTLAKRDIAGLASRYINSVDALAGRQLRRPLAAGELLTADALIDLPVVRRGQTVTLLASLHGIEVRGSGVALADAARSERVRVRSLASQREVDGIVRDTALVEVPL